MHSPGSSPTSIAANNTVKLSEAMRERVLNAMEAEGFTVWSEFCRIALMGKCKATEQKLLSRDSAEFLRIYRRPGLARDGADGG
jgi:hypothetical protein